MQRRVLSLKVPNEWGDDTGDYLAVCHVHLQRYRQKYNLERWHVSALSRVFDWAGHVGRFSKWAPERLAHKALVYRGGVYLQTLENMFGQQAHGRKFKVWRWEQQFTRVFGQDWIHLTWDSEDWASSRSAWVARRTSWHKQ
eukprot:7054929-Pyramimonas_sp.AAC.1